MTMIHKCLVLFLLFPISSFSNGLILGKIVDDKSLPLAYATVALYSADSTLINGDITNESGAFSFNKIRNGYYYLEVNFIGYQKLIVPNIELHSAIKNLDLGRIQLTVDHTLLNDVEITADKLYIQNKIDRKIIQIGQNPSAMSGNLGDVLADISSFSTDASGAISFRGSQNYKVLIDGKPSGLSGSQALQSIPGAYVKEIEVLTNPSARYIADSEAGIINVIMRKAYKNGLSGQSGLSYDYRDKGNYHGELRTSLHVKKEKVRFYFQASTSSDSIQLDGHTDIWIDGDEYRFDRHREARQLLWASNLNGQAGIDATISKRNTLSIWSAYNFSQSDYTALNFDKDQETGLQPYWGKLDYHNDRIADQWQLTLDDNIEFENGKLQLMVDYSKATNSRDNFRNYFTTDHTFAQTTEFIDSTIFNQEELRSRWHSEINYLINLTDSSKLEIGFLHEYYSRNNTFKEYNFDLLQSNTDVKYRFSIYNFYTTYSGNLGKLDYQLGARFEYSVRKLDRLLSTDLFAFFPSLHVSRALTNNYDLNFSYSKRIRRPSVYDLSPIFLYADNQVTWKGNPNLTDAMVHALELESTKAIGSSTISASVFYRYINNGWYRFLKSEGNSKFLNFPEQVDHEKNSGVEIMTDIVLSNKLNLKAGGTLFKQHIVNKGEINDLSSNSSRYNLSFNYSITESLNFKIQGIYNGPRIAANSTIKESYVLTAIMQYQMLRNRLNITLSAKDFTSSDIYQQHYSGLAADGNYYNLKEFYSSNSRFYSIGLNYSFSNFSKKSIKRNIQIIE